MGLHFVPWKWMALTPALNSAGDVRWRKETCEKVTLLVAAVYIKLFSLCGFTVVALVVLFFNCLFDWYRFTSLTKLVPCYRV